MSASVSTLANLSNKELKVLSSELRNQILDACLTYGGHLSSNLGSVELTIGLVRAFDPYENDILFDVGHQTYAYKILTGRNLNNHRNVSGEAPLSDPEESEADPYLNGHAGTAISTAYGMAKVKETKGDNSYTIAVVGDSSVVNGMSMEALSLLGSENIKNLIIVINDNGMSIGKDVSFFGKQFKKLRNSRLYFRTSSWLGRKMSKHKWSWRLFLRLRGFKDKIKHVFVKPTFFETMGLKYIGPYDGHDLESLDLAFEKAKSVAGNGPVVVHIITKKGYGYDRAMNDEEGRYHGVKGMEADPDENQTDFDRVKAQYLESYLGKDESAYVICPAMVLSSGLQSVYDKYPERAIDCGIAEENAVTMAGGIALQGGYPIVDIYSTFLQRSYDQVFEDISREKVPSLFYIERAGLVGQDGASHHGLYDVSFLKTIPGARILQPYDRQSFEKMSSDVLEEKKGFVSIRLSTDNFLDGENSYYSGEPITYISAKDSDVLVLSVGVKGFELAQKCAQNDVSSAVLTSLLPSEEELEASISENVKLVVFYDAYSTIEGSSRIIENYCLKHSIEFVSYSFDVDFYTFGKVEDLYRMYSMDVDSIYQEILLILNNR